MNESIEKLSNFKEMEQAIEYIDLCPASPSEKAQLLFKSAAYNGILSERYYDLGMEIVNRKDHKSAYDYLMCGLANEKMNRYCEAVIYLEKALEMTHSLSWKYAICAIICRIKMKKYEGGNDRIVYAENACFLFGKAIETSEKMWQREKWELAIEEIRRLSVD